MKAGFLLSLLAATTALAAPPKKCHPHPKPGKGLGLDQLAKKRGGRYVGTATEPEILERDPPYAKIAESKEFSGVTPENRMKWESIEPQPGVFNFTRADELVQWSKKHKKDIRGHTLVWHSQLAPWVTANNYTAEELKAITKNHVQTVARHFKGQIKWWDVVNEVFNEDGTYRSSIFYDTFGEDFIEWSFRWAHEADPHAKLYINDYNFEAESPLKTDAVTNLVRKLKAKGVPIHGIGAQGHFIQGTLDGPAMTKIWKTWSDELKVDVAITELDIRMEMPVTPEKLEEQAADYKTVFDACLAVKRCIGITLWQYTDKYTWVPDVFAGQGAPCPWDENLEKKPAYYAIVDSLKNSPSA